MSKRDPKSAAGLLVVGKDVPRTDAIPKVTGAAQYVADLHLPGMLHAAVLRSPHPHARIVSIDVSAAGSDLVARLPDASYAAVAPGNHFTFLAECKPEAPALLVAEGEDPICDEPAGTDRAGAHAEIAVLIAAFLGLDAEAQPATTN